MKDFRYWSWIPAALATLLLGLVVFRSPIAIGLWLDECVTFWISGDSWQTAFDRALGFQGQSPLYFLGVYGWRALFGDSEIALRLPSVLLSLGTILAVVSLGQRTAAGGALALALILLVSIDSFQTAAWSARPYALGLFLVTMALMLSRSWVDQPRWVTLASFLIFGSLAVLAHFIFVLFLPVQMVLVWLWRKDLSKRDLSIYLTALLLHTPAVFLGWLQAHQLALRTSSLRFVPDPEIADVLTKMLPAGVLIGCALGFVVTRSLGVLTWRAGEGQDVTRSDLIFFGWWGFFPPLAILAASLLIPDVSFVSRYFVWHTPGLVLLVAALVAKASNAKGFAVFVISCFACVAFREGVREWRDEGWRDALETHKAELQESGDPIVFYSGLVEAEQLEYLFDLESRTYLAAPVVTYAPELLNQVRLSPGDLNVPAANGYFKNVLVPWLKGKRAFWLIYFERKVFDQHGNVDVAMRKGRALFESAGFLERSVGEHGSVRVWRYYLTD